MKKFSQFFLFLSGVLAFYGLCEAQPASIFVDEISVEEGLSESTITDILQDQRGFLWIGTQDGLNRYNGYDFDIFRSDTKDSSSISGNHITSLFEDSAGFIWVHIFSEGLNRLDPRTNEFKSMGDMFPDTANFEAEEVTAIGQDASGKIIFLDHQRILTCIPGAEKIEQLTDLSDHLDDLNISAIDMDESGNIWILDNGKRLILYHTENRKFNVFDLPEGQLQQVNPSSVNSIFSDANGNLWFGRADGIYTLDVLTGKIRRIAFESKTAIRDDKLQTNVIYQDNRGIIWAGTDMGLFRLNQKLNIFEEVQLFGTTGNSSPSITSIFSGKFGILWIGTRYSGLLKHVYNSQDFGFISDNEFITAITGGANGEFWVGIRNGEIKKIDKGGRIIRRFEFINPGKTVSDNSITTLFRDRNGDIWAGAAGGLNLIREDEINRIEPKNAYVISVSVIHEDQMGNIWIGAEPGNLYTYNRDTNLRKKYEAFNDSGIIQGKDVSAIYKDYQGDLWIGTRGGGLFRYLPETGKTRHYSKDDGLNSNIVHAISGDKRSALWIGTSDGLNQFDLKSESITSFSTADGLPNNVIHGLLWDADGHLWLSTNAGLAQFDPVTLSITVFDKGDGILFNEFRKGLYYKSESGKMYFGGSKGIISFHPDSLQVNQIPPDLVLNGLFVLSNNGGLFKPTGQNFLLSNKDSENNYINLTDDQNSVQIQYTALHYAAPTQNRYRYKLEGYDNIWHETQLGEAIYTNLKPGEYIFKVKAANKHGFWTEEEKTITIAISAPFWATSWAYVMYAVFILGVTALLLYLRNSGKNNKYRGSKLADKNIESTVQSRTQQLEAEKNKSDQLLYNMLPHEIADEIKETGHATPRRYEHVTVVFTDFENFTEKASTLSVKKLVDEINEIFEAFDSITKKNGLEKIKTIGDAYMAVSGLPNETEDHAVRCVEAAMEMLQFIKKRNKKSAITWNMRVGIHSGNVIAGVVGKNKFTYDIWGNTVIVANRMEEAGIPGTVNISSSTYKLIESEFECELRGSIAAAPGGDTEMYIVKSKK